MNKNMNMNKKEQESNISIIRLRFVGESDIISSLIDSPSWERLGAILLFDDIPMCVYYIDLNYGGFIWSISILVGNSNRRF